MTKYEPSNGLGVSEPTEVPSQVASEILVSTAPQAESAQMPALSDDDEGRASTTRNPVDTDAAEAIESEETGTISQADGEGGVDVAAGEAALANVLSPFDWNRERKWTYKDGFNVARHQIGYRDTPQGRVVFERGKPCKGVETDVNADWTEDMSRVQRVPYNANKVCVSKLLLFVENESVANFLRDQLDAARRAQPNERKRQQLGLIVATTMSGGPGKSHLTPLERYLGRLKAVAVFPSNDDAGRAHAQDICGICAPRTRFTKMVELPGLPHGGGVKDFFRAGGTVYDLFALIKAASEWAPSHPTDDDAGQEFVSTAGQVPPEND